MQEGALSRLVYFTAYSSISFFLPFPHPPPFIYSTTSPFIITTFSFSPIISLSVCLSRLEFRSSPFHPLIASVHAPFFSVIFSFPFATFPFPSLRGLHAVLPIYPTGEKRERKIVRLFVNYTGGRGGCIGEATTAGGVATPPKMLMRQSIRDFRRRNSSVVASASLSIRKFIHHP